MSAPLPERGDSVQGAEGALIPRVELPEYRVCDRCNQLRVAEDFYGTTPTCKDCHTLLSKRDLNERYEEMQALVCNTAFRSLVADRKGKKIDAPHISELVAKLIEKMGGIEGLSDFYVKQIRDAAEDDPGGRRVLDACRTLANLVTASTEHRSSAPDVESLTEDELLAEYKSLTMHTLTSDKDGFRRMLQLVHEKAPELLEFKDADH